MGMYEGEECTAHNLHVEACMPDFFLSLFFVKNWCKLHSTLKKTLNEWTFLHSLIVCADHWKKVKTFVSFYNLGYSVILIFLQEVAKLCYANIIRSFGNLGPYSALTFLQYPAGSSTLYPLCSLILHQNRINTRKKKEEKCERTNLERSSSCKLGWSFCILWHFKENKQQHCNSSKSRDWNLKHFFIFKNQYVINNLVAQTDSPKTYIKCSGCARSFSAHRAMITNYMNLIWIFWKVVMGFP